MRVIIKKTGEIKEVALGYAVNYLLPKKLADIATAKRLTALKQTQAKEQEQKAEKTDADRKLAERLDGKVISFSKTSGKSGKIHGSITKKEIAMELSILKTNVILPEPIKKVGSYEVTLKFGQAGAKVKVKVV